MRTYRLDGFFCDAIDGLGNLVDLVCLVVVDEAGTGVLNSCGDVLAVLKLLELGSSLGLLEELLGNITSSDLLDELDSGLGSLRNVFRVAGDGSVQETGIGVDGAGGLDLGSGRSLCVAEQREAGGPLDAGLSTEQRSEDSNLRLVELAGEGAGSRESNDESVGLGVSDALLSSVVLGLLGAGCERLDGRIPNVTEEFVCPLVQLTVLGSVSHEGKVGLGVCDLGEPLDRVGLEVLSVRVRRGGSGGVAETAVEGEAVSRVDGHLERVGEESLVGELEHGEDLLEVDVG